ASWRETLLRSRQTHDHELGRLSRPMVRHRRPQSDHVRERHHRYFHGPAYVLLHHYMGELDGAFRSWGFARGGMGTISRVIADAARCHGAEIRAQAPV